MMVKSSNVYTITLKAWCPVLEIMKNLKGYQLGLKCNFELINIVEGLQIHM